MDTHIGKEESMLASLPDFRVANDVIFRCDDNPGISLQVLGRRTPLGTNLFLSEIRYSVLCDVARAEQFVDGSHVVHRWMSYQKILWKCARHGHGFILLFLC